MLGSLLLQERRPDALQYFEAAAQIAPWDPASHRAVGAALQDRGDLQGAIREYRIVLHARDPKLLAYTYANLGVIYRQLGNDAAARQNSDLALRSDPGTVRQMIQQLSGVVQARPTAPGYLRLGLLLEGAGQIQDAKSAFARALQLDPGRCCHLIFDLSFHLAMEVGPGHRRSHRNSALGRGASHSINLNYAAACNRTGRRLRSGS